jgi:hypothetical protein
MGNRLDLESGIGQEFVELLLIEKPDMLESLPMVTSSLVEIPGKIQETNPMLFGHSDELRNELDRIKNMLQDIMTDHHVKMIGREIDILKPFPVDKLIVGLACIMVLTNLTAVCLSTYPSGLIHKSPRPGTYIKDCEPSPDPVVLATAGRQLQIMLVVLGLVVTTNWGILGPIIFPVAVLISEWHLQLTDDPTFSASSQGCFFALNLGGDSCRADLESFFLHPLKLGTATYTIDVSHG